MLRNKSDATPVPDNEGGQTSTSAAAAATKGGASTSDLDQDGDKKADDKKAEAAKKPKYALGQAIEKVRRFIIGSSTSLSSHSVSHAYVYLLLIALDRLAQWL